MTSSRDIRLREVLVHYIRLQLKLGAIQNMAGDLSLLDDLHAAVFRDLQKSNFGSQFTPGSLTKAQEAYVKMLAELSFQYCQQQRPKMKFDLSSAGETEPTPFSHDHIVYY